MGDGDEGYHATTCPNAGETNHSEPKTPSDRAKLECPRLSRNPLALRERTCGAALKGQQGVNCAVESSFFLLCKLETTKHNSKPGVGRGRAWVMEAMVRVHASMRALCRRVLGSAVQCICGRVGVKQWRGRTTTRHRARHWSVLLVFHWLLFSPLPRSRDELAECVRRCTGGLPVLDAAPHTH